MQKSTKSSKPIATTNKVDTFSTPGILPSSAFVLQPLAKSASVGRINNMHTNGKVNSIDELAFSVFNALNTKPASSLVLLLHQQHSDNQSHPSYYLLVVHHPTATTRSCLLPIILVPYQVLTH
jgi:hypothetical protein